MPFRIHKFFYTVIALFLFALAQPAAAQQRPLITEDVDIIPPGTVRLETGIDFLQGAKFPASGLTGDLTRVGVIGISIGFAPNVEFQIEGVAQNFLSINTRASSAIPLSLAPGANSTNDTSERATCAITNPLRTRFQRAASPLPRPPSLRNDCK